METLFNTPMIDRLEPTRRPPGPPRGYQQWRSLLFMHWPIPVEEMRAVVPLGLELDLYQGAAYVGVVPFIMKGVRPRWWPASLAFDFLETNVRTYVHCGGRPGVYFLSLEASSRLAVWAASQFWGLPYYNAAMTVQRAQDELHYQSTRLKKPARHDVRCRLGKLLGPSQPDSLEFFFLERYLLFVERQGQIFAGQVHHTPYPAQEVEVLHVDDQLVSAAGLKKPDGPPAFAHYASGVDVEVFGLTRV